MHARMCSQYTDITYTCMYLFIGVYTLNAHQNAHQMEKNQKCIESILFTLFFLNSWAMRFVRANGNATTTCDKMAYALAVLLLFNYT